MRRTTVVAGLALALMTGGALAAGGGGGSGGSDGGSSGGGETRSVPIPPPPPACGKGQAWNAAKAKCVLFSSELPDEDILEHAYRLAKDSQDYTQALAVLDMVRDPQTPRALNYRGYFTRKLGRVDEGIGYYLQSVKLDPTYVQVREYLGEAYVITGRLDLAAEQLKVIDTLCGAGCAEFQTLSRAIENPTAGSW